MGAIGGSGRTHGLRACAPAGFFAPDEAGGLQAVAEVFDLGGVGQVHRPPLVPASPPRLGRRPTELRVQRKLFRSGFTEPGYRRTSEAWLRSSAHRLFLLRRKSLGEDPRSFVCKGSSSGPGSQNPATDGLQRRGEGSSPTACSFSPPRLAKIHNALHVNPPLQVRSKRSIMQRPLTHLFTSADNPPAPPAMEGALSLRSFAGGGGALMEASPRRQRQVRRGQIKSNLEPCQPFHGRRLHRGCGLGSDCALRRLGRCVAFG